MCDTFIALPNATSDGTVLFGKNSDREPNEAQHLYQAPAENHPAGSLVKCTYLEIPQTAHTHAVLLSKPFWTWGAEMGANEYGVVIGNEAVFTRMPREKNPALTGLDLVRLGLERGATAREALDAIVQLLETYGQGGNCGFTHPFFYDNSYLIGDRREAWVLETAGQEWAALQVKDYYSISNAITIHGEWDRASASLVDFAVSRGWCRNAGDFDYARCYSDPLVTRFSAAAIRRQQTTRGIQSCARGLGLQEAMDMLRDHQPAGVEQENLDKPILGSKVCMHLGFGPVRINQTVGSMVSQLSSSGDPSRDTHWFTATAAPCTGVFKPLWIDTRLPAHGLTPKGTYDEHALFWQHERLHRAVLQDYQERLDSFKRDRDALEARFRAGAARFASGETEHRQEYSEACFQKAWTALDRWLECVQNIPLSKRNVFYYRSTWDRVNRQARMPGKI